MSRERATAAPTGLKTFLTNQIPTFGTSSCSCWRVPIGSDKHCTNQAFKLIFIIPYWF